MTDEAHRLFDGLPVLLRDTAGREVARGHFVLFEPKDSHGAATLNVAFTIGGVAFMVGIPDESLPTLARTWTGDHFVMERPAGEWVSRSPPVEP